MTTATAARAWTEVEIREALADLDPRMDLDDSLWKAIGPLRDSDMARVRIGWDVDYYPRSDHPGTLWADLRPDEEDDLNKAIDGAIAAARLRFVDDLRERLVKVALAFDTAHPEAPRGHWRPAAEREQVQS